MKNYVWKNWDINTKNNLRFFAIYINRFYQYYIKIKWKVCKQVIFKYKFIIFKIKIYLCYKKVYNLLIKDF